MTTNAAPEQRKRQRIERINVGRNHYYKIDGRKADGVTTVIGKALAKPALPAWAAKTVAAFVADAGPDELAALRRLGRDAMIDALKAVPWAERDAAALRGTNLHSIAEKLTNGEAVEYDDAIAGYVESTVNFLNEWRVAPVLTEAVVASRRFHYAGTVDLIADLPDGRRAVIDFKSGRSGIFPETCLQIAAYRFADVCIDPLGDEADLSLLDVDCGYGVWLRADGYDVVPLRCDRDVFRVFLHVLQVARAVDTMREWVGEPESWQAVRP